MTRDGEEGKSEGEEGGGDAGRSATATPSSSDTQLIRREKPGKQDRSDDDEDGSRRSGCQAKNGQITAEVSM